jgi:hydroxypyruvate isomerase
MAVRATASPGPVRRITILDRQQSCGSQRPTVGHGANSSQQSDWYVAVCEVAGSPRVKLLYDIYHMQIMEGDVIRTIRENIDHIAHFHTAGNPGRNELDDTQEVNYPPIMRAIAATSFSGYVGQEFVPLGEPIVGLEAGFKICDV